MTPEERELSKKIGELIAGIKDIANRIEALEIEHKQVSHQIDNIGQQLKDDAK